MLLKSLHILMRLYYKQPRPPFRYSLTHSHSMEWLAYSFLINLQIIKHFTTHLSNLSFLLYFAWNLRLLTFCCCCCCAKECDVMLSRKCVLSKNKMLTYVFRFDSQHDISMSRQFPCFLSSFFAQENVILY